jgi:hypothetical protein
MRHPIDPKIDCVFKALLGAEDHRNLLVHFLNAVLDQPLQPAIAERPGLRHAVAHYAIWLLGANLRHDDPGYAHRCAWPRS